MTQDPLPPLDPAARRDAALGALRLVAAHDGQWYWYQLDRALSADHPGPFFAEIDALAAAGLIEVRRVPEPGAVRYHLTARGASVRQARVRKRRLRSPGRTHAPVALDPRTMHLYLRLIPSEVARGQSTLGTPEGHVAA